MFFFTGPVCGRILGGLTLPFHFHRITLPFLRLQILQERPFTGGNVQICTLTLTDVQFLILTTKQSICGLGVVDFCVCMI